MGEQWMPGATHDACSSTPPSLKSRCCHCPSVRPCVRRASFCPSICGIRLPSCPPARPSTHPRVRPPGAPGTSARPSICSSIRQPTRPSPPVSACLDRFVRPSVRPPISARRLSVSARLRLSPSIFDHLCPSLSVFVHLCPSLFTCPSVRPSLSIRPSPRALAPPPAICPSILPCVLPSIRAPFRPSARPSPIRPSTHLCPSACLLYLVLDNTNSAGQS